MITIWKLENDSWVLVSEYPSQAGLHDFLELLREDGIFRAELKTDLGSKILEDYWQLMSISSMVHYPQDNQE